jgi:putative ABC transport system ATP-binding protein
MNQATAAVTMSDVQKAYGEGSTATSVLRGVSLSIRRGECVFLAGPSGSGKSTLLSILGCILTPDQGTATVLGCDIKQLNAAQRSVLRRDRIGFVFQRFNLIRGLTALENICVPLTLRGVSVRTARARAEQLLREVGLMDKANCHPRRLSSGQCQRVAVARALAGDPDLILADEPTASLDANNGGLIIELLRRLTVQYGKTTVVVTHDRRIFGYADRVLHLRNGKIIADEDSTNCDDHQGILVSV